MEDQKLKNIPSGWKETTLGEVAVLNYGKSLNMENRTIGEIPVYGSSGITGFHNEALINKEGYIIGRKGTVGSIYHSPVPFFPIDTVYYATKKDIKTDFGYFFYLLKTLGLNKLDFDSAVPGLNRNMAYSLQINIPEKEHEQKAIAEVLSSFDNKIKLLRKQNKTLENIAQALFKRWFIDFEFPNKERKPYKSSGGKLIDSEMGKIPNGWKIGKLGEVTEVRGGTTPSTENADYWNGTIHWTSPKDLSNSRDMFLLDTDKKITEKGILQIGSGLLPEGTLLLSSRAPIGYLAITNIPVAINQGYIALLPGSMFSTFYTYLWLQKYMREIISAANGSTFLEISKGSFKKVSCVIPEKNILNDFQTVITLIFKKILLNILQIKTLSKMRDTVLPKLMKGEVRVKI